MADDGFNGSTFAIGTPVQTPLLSVDYTNSAAKVKTTGSEATTTEYVAGIPDESMTFTIVGVTDVSIGDSGVITCTWFDGSTTVFTNGIVVEVGTSGSENDTITSTITTVPTAS